MQGLALVPFLPKVCDEPVEHAVEQAFHTMWPVHAADAAHEKKH